MSTCDPVLIEIKSRRGAVKAIAAACSLTPQAVSQWRRVPRWHVEAVSTVTGISRHELRPDVFGPAPSEAGKERAA